MSTETKKTWWETEFPKLEREREKRSLKAYAEREKNIMHYRRKIEEWSQKPDARFCRERFSKKTNNGFVFESPEVYKPVITREDVEKLKKDWLQDGTWDIWEVEGFEEFSWELKAFQYEKMFAWLKDELQKSMAISKEWEDKANEYKDILSKNKAYDNLLRRVTCLLNEEKKDVL